MSVLKFILFSMVSTLIGILGLAIILACIILVFDLFNSVYDNVGSRINHKQTYQGSEDSDE